MRRFIIITSVFIYVALSSFLSQAGAIDNKPKEKNAPVIAKNNEYYKIAAGDVLAINVYEEQDLSGDFEVKEDGTITYPLLGQISVLNLTKKETEDKIGTLLKDGYLVNPYVRVSVGKFRDRNIMILGCVQKPGSYPFPQNGRISLLKAIVEAGGFTGYASIGGTRIVRTNADGNKTNLDPRINDIISGRKEDVDLEPNDLIVVPERLF